MTTLNQSIMSETALSGDFPTVNPGSPVDFDAATGAGDADYEPAGATRLRATGLVSAYSGADTAGLEATPLMPVSAMSQVVAQPFHVSDTGDGGNSGVPLLVPTKVQQRYMNGILLATPQCQPILYHLTEELLDKALLPVLQKINTYPWLDWFPTMLLVLLILVSQNLWDSQIQAMWQQTFLLL